MKRLRVLGTILLILILQAFYAQLPRNDPRMFLDMIVRRAILGEMERAAMAAPTYFGNNVAAAPTNTTLNSRVTQVRVAMSGMSLVCPTGGGSNHWNIVDLSAWCRTYSGGSGNIRLGIYYGDLLVAQTSAEIDSLSDSGWAWHPIYGTDMPTFTWHNGYTYLTGGVTYRLAVGGDTTNGLLGGESGTANDSYEVSADYTGGMLDWPSSSSLSNKFSIRCGVEEIAITTTAPKLMLLGVGNSR